VGEWALSVYWCRNKVGEWALSVSIDPDPCLYWLVYFTLCTCSPAPPVFSVGRSERVNGGRSDGGDQVFVQVRSILSGGAAAAISSAPTAGVALSPSSSSSSSSSSSPSTKSPSDASQSTAPSAAPVRPPPTSERRSITFTGERVV
jgi:hypothetical protein